MGYMVLSFKPQTLNTPLSYMGYMVLSLNPTLNLALLLPIYELHGKA
jgi:hypothetical protein